MYLRNIQNTEMVSSVLPRKEQKMLLLILCRMISQTEYKKRRSTTTSVDAAVKLMFNYFKPRPCTYKEKS